jgi:phenylpropionate dioxygenase-like ring-hydroxylating dioxygenase large terminal subunit
MEGYHLTPVHRTTLHPMTPTSLCEKIPGGKGYTGYKSHYSPSFKGRTQVHPDMTDEERTQSMMIWIYPGFVAAISPNSSVFMSITPDGAESLQTRWGIVAREEVFDAEEAQERIDFARAFNHEDRERLLDVQRGLRSRYASRGFLAPPDYEGTVWDFYHYLAGKLL